MGEIVCRWVIGPVVDKSNRSNILHAGARVWIELCQLFLYMYVFVNVYICVVCVFKDALRGHNLVPIDIL
jgi:hypothetical protein